MPSTMIEIEDYDVAFSTQDEAEGATLEQAYQKGPVEVALLMFEQSDARMSLPDPKTAQLYPDRVVLDFHDVPLKMQFLNLPEALHDGLDLHASVWICAMKDGLVAEDWRIPLQKAG